MLNISKKIGVIYLVLVLLIIINLFIDVSFFNILFLIILSLLCCFFTGKIRNRNKNKSMKNKKVILIIFGYLLVYFLSGLFFSYSNNHIEIENVINGFGIYLLPIMFIEYIRYRLISFNRDRKNIIFVICLLTLLELSMFGFNNLILNIIINITSTYLLYRIDYLSSYIYRIILSLIPLFPIIPSVDLVINSLFLIILLLVFIYSIEYMTMLEDRKNKRRDIKRSYSISNLFFIIAVIIFILFMFGLLKYQPIAIMSNSMVDYFAKGDVVVIEDITQDDVCDLKIGEVIYYEHDNRFITHRIHDKVVNEESCIFYTKGDNNDIVDDWIVDKTDVYGVIKFRVKYLGWPSVLLNELLS